jgi:hypothetical protein
MNKPSYRAARLVTFGAGLALLLGACGESAPPEGEQQQGSVSPPAAADQATAEATTESAQTSQ